MRKRWVPTASTTWSGDGGWRRRPPTIHRGHDETLSFGDVEWRPEDRQGHDLDRQRRAVEHAVLVQHAFRRRRRDESGRVDRGGARRLFLDAAVGAARR